jgi:hypothetical protein
MSIEDEVANDIAARQRKGIAKYGTTVADNPLCFRAWLQHGYEEALDLAIYLKRALRELPVSSPKQSPSSSVSPPKGESVSSPASREVEKEEK